MINPVPFDTTKHMDTNYTCINAYWNILKPLEDKIRIIVEAYHNTTSDDEKYELTRYYVRAAALEAVNDAYLRGVERGAFCERLNQSTIEED